jgi:hypothetical protein
MAPDRQLEFSRKWWTRANTESDPFDRFFSLWIALVVAANRHATSSGGPYDDPTDADLVKSYFEAKQSAVLSALSRNERGMQSLAARRGSIHGNPILDTGNRDLRQHFTNLSRHYAGQARLSPELLVSYTAELLNKIRNNLFHGRKIYDDREDLALLELVTPLLSDILALAEEFRV